MTALSHGRPESARTFGRAPEQDPEIGGPVLSESEARAVRRGVPDPGIPLPRVAVPTVLLFVTSLALWGLATWLVLGTETSAWLTVPLHAVVTFTMFTVLHEASHHAAGRLRWANELLGRLSLPFVACYTSFGMFRYVHIEHHRNTNESIDIDPDAWTSHGPAWQLPLRWSTVDAWYARFYAPRAKNRPRAEVRELGMLASATVVGLGVAVVTGHFAELALIYLIPQRIGVTVLAWWFDWLPHHNLSCTAAQNRFRATRMRVGLEWLLTPVMLYQNYHLVHHLHPAIPFYRYIDAWRRNQNAYLDRDVPITTAWGRELSASEYRAWRHITESFQREKAADHDFQPLTVSEVRKLTPESVSISFSVPEHMRPRFQFVPGQHITLRRFVGDREIRRTYSICASAASDMLRIAVKRIEGGEFSEYLTRHVRRGEVLDVLPPSGRFVLNPRKGNAKHYVGIAGGSGITPIISMLSTALAEETESRFTLLYANKTAVSTMFGDQLEMLARHYEGRLRIIHFRSVSGAVARSGFEEIIPGRLDRTWLAELLNGMLRPDDVDEWFLCGPQGLVDDSHGLLRERGLQNIRCELFHAEPSTAPTDDAVHSAITVTSRGSTTTVRGTAQESVLEAALRSGVDAPYACMGGACGTCRAKLVTGRVRMDLNYVLNEREVADGHVLTCQARPVTDRTEVDYDARM